MTPREKALIDDLFDRIIRNNAGPKDQEAAALIGRRANENPDAAYALTQIALVQAEAIRQAEARIAELEQRGTAPAPSGGSFLGGASTPWSRAGSAPPQPAPQPAYQQPAPAAGSWGAPAPMPMAQAPSQAGGFLRSALTTAAGVAGGALLFEGVRNMFGGHGGLGGMGGFGGAGLGGFGGGTTINETVNETVYVEPSNVDNDRKRFDVADDDSDSTAFDGGSDDQDI